jgi:hypothetical protein
MFRAKPETVIVGVWTVSDEITTLYNLTNLQVATKSRDNAVGTATGYGLDDRGVESR